MNSADRYDSLFIYYAEKYGHSFHLLKRQAEVESSLNPDAESDHGAQGLSQFLPATFAEVAGKLKLRNPSAFNPEHAIACQAAYMQYLMIECSKYLIGIGATTFNNDIRCALAAYNWGLSNVKSRKPWPDSVVQYVDKILSSVG